MTRYTELDPIFQWVAFYPHRSRSLFPPRSAKLGPHAYHHPPHRAAEI